MESSSSSLFENYYFQNEYRISNFKAIEDKGVINVLSSQQKYRKFIKFPDFPALDFKNFKLCDEYYHEKIGPKNVRRYRRKIDSSSLNFLEHLYNKVLDEKHSSMDHHLLSENILKVNLQDISEHILSSIIKHKSQQKPDLHSIEIEFEKYENEKKFEGGFGENVDEESDFSVMSKMMHKMSKHDIFQLLKTRSVKSINSKAKSNFNKLTYDQDQDEEEIFKGDENFLKFCKMLMTNSDKIVNTANPLLSLYYNLKIESIFNNLLEDDKLFDSLMNETQQSISSLSTSSDSNSLGTGLYITSLKTKLKSRKMSERLSVFKSERKIFLRFIELLLESRFHQYPRKMVFCLDHLKLGNFGEILEMGNVTDCVMLSDHSLDLQKIMKNRLGTEQNFNLEISLHDHLEKLSSMAFFRENTSIDSHKLVEKLEKIKMNFDFIIKEVHETGKIPDYVTPNFFSLNGGLISSSSSSEVEDSDTKDFENGGGGKEDFYPSQPEKVDTEIEIDEKHRDPDDDADQLNFSFNSETHQAETHQAENIYDTIDDVDYEVVAAAKDPDEISDSPPLLSQSAAATAPPIIVNLKEKLLVAYTDFILKHNTNIFKSLDQLIMDEKNMAEYRGFSKNYNLNEILDTIVSNEPLKNISNNFKNDIDTISNNEFMVNYIVYNFLNSSSISMFRDRNRMDEGLVLNKFKSDFDLTMVFNNTITDISDGFDFNNTTTTAAAAATTTKSTRKLKRKNGKTKKSAVSAAAQYNNDKFQTIKNTLSKLNEDFIFGEYLNKMIHKFKTEPQLKKQLTNEYVMVGASFSSLTKMVKKIDVASKIKNLPNPFKVAKKNVSEVPTNGLKNEDALKNIVENSPDDVVKNFDDAPAKFDNGKSFPDENQKLKRGETSPEDFFKNDCKSSSWPEDPEVAESLSKDLTEKLDDDLPDMSLKKMDDDVDTVTNASKKSDVESAENLKNDPEYSKAESKEAIDNEIDSNSSINQMEDDLVKKESKIPKDKVRSVVTKALTISLIGGAAYGTFKLCIQPWLQNASGCLFVNKQVSNSHPVSLKCVQESCKYPDSGKKQKGGHPFQGNIEDWMRSHTEGDVVDPLVSESTKGYDVCTQLDVEQYGDCGGWCNFDFGNPLGILVSDEQLPKGSYLYCDPPKNIFEAATDIAINTSTEFASDVVNGVVDFGSNVSGHLIGNLITSPLVQVLITGAVGIATLMFTKNIGITVIAVIIMIVIFLILNYMYSKKKNQVQGVKRRTINDDNGKMKMMRRSYKKSSSSSLMNRVKEVKDVCVDEFTKSINTIHMMNDF